MNPCPDLQTFLADLQKPQVRAAILSEENQKIKQGFSFLEKATYEAREPVKMPLQMVA